MVNKILSEVKEKLQGFREDVYAFFHHRRDATMELVDALSTNTQAQSIVELSLNPHHRRDYCSITRVLDEFYSTKEKKQQNGEQTRLLSQICPVLEKRSYHLFTTDCTPNPRIFSPTLSDRSPVHAPNPVLGNKPITIGHQYNVAVYLPEKKATDSPPWVIPLSCERVGTTEKSILLGMKQIQRCINSKSDFKDELCVSVADCAYSTPECIVETRKNSNWVHISRLRNNRNLYYPALQKETRKRRGRPKRYGSMIQLKKSGTWGNQTGYIEFEEINKKGDKQIVKIKHWKNILIRGKKEFQLSTFLFDVVKIEIYKSDGKLLYQRPLW